MTTTAAGPAKLKIDLVPLDKIKPHPNNKRKGDLETIKTGLETYDQYAPLVVQRATGYVLVGNHRYLAAAELGWPKINVTYRDVDDEQAERLLLFDNRASDKGTYDMEGLVEALRSIGDLEGTGYEASDVDELARITGQLAQESTRFLDGMGDGTAGGGSTGGGGREYHQLGWPVTAEQRDAINGALKQARTDFAVDTSVEALVRLAKWYMDDGRRELATAANDAGAARA